LKTARIGFLGHTFEWMMDMQSDPTMLSGHFGLHVEMLEMGDLHKRVDEVTASALAGKVKEIKKYFHFPPPGSDPIAGPVSEESLAWSARVACGLEALVSDFDLQGMAYYYHGRYAEKYVELISGMIVGNSILTGKGIPIAGEGDLKNCLAMLITDRFGDGGSFAEFHPADFRDDFVLVGHDGPGHIAISDEKPILRGLRLFHGKSGHGASVEFKVKTGPITILGLTQTFDGRFKFVAAEGLSVPGPIPKSGNTNTRGRFAPDVATFVERWSIAGPTHHFALGVGHNLSKIKKLTDILQMELEVVCRKEDLGQIG
jgi:L-arabinose isomerase